MSLRDAQTLFEQRGILRTSQALALGIAPATLYRLRDAGLIEEVARGIFRRANLPPLSNPDVVAVALRYPAAVINLLSALAYYELTTHIPRAVYVALPQGSKRPRSEHPPLEVVWLSGRHYETGLTHVTIDSVEVPIYEPEKVICDCFKFRHKYGEDIALEALRFYLEQPAARRNLPGLLRAARLTRTETVITPYLKALT